jgi:hypothetical protein
VNTERLWNATFFGISCKTAAETEGSIRAKCSPGCGTSATRSSTIIGIAHSYENNFGFQETQPDDPDSFGCREGEYHHGGIWPWLLFAEAAGRITVGYCDCDRALGFVVKQLRSVPHTLTPTQKTERATLSIEFLRQLRSIEHHGWQFIITLNESWFSLSAHHGHIRLLGKNNPLKDRGIPYKTQK